MRYYLLCFRAKDGATLVDSFGKTVFMRSLLTISPTSAFLERLFALLKVQCPVSRCGTRLQSAMKLLHVAKTPKLQRLEGAVGHLVKFAKREHMPREYTREKLGRLKIWPSALRNSCPQLCCYPPKILTRACQSLSVSNILINLLYYVMWGKDNRNR